MFLLRQPVQKQERSRAAPKLAPRAAALVVLLRALDLRPRLSRVNLAAGRGRHLRLLRRGVCAVGRQPRGPRAPGDGPGLGGAHPPPAGPPQVPRVQQLQEVLPRRPLPPALEAQPRGHEREVDEYAGKCVYAGRGPATASGEMKGSKRARGWVRVAWDCWDDDSADKLAAAQQWDAFFVLFFWVAWEKVCGTGSLPIPTFWRATVAARNNSWRSIQVDDESRAHQQAWLGNVQQPEPALEAGYIRRENE